MATNCSKYGWPARRMTQDDEKAPRVLTAGYLTLDLIVRDLAKRDFWHSAGGTCGNVSIFSSALGLDVTLLARVGDDQRGHRILSDVANAGVDATGIEKISTLATPGIVELINGTATGTHRFTNRCPACATVLPKQAVVSQRQVKARVKSIKQFNAFFFDRATSSTLLLAKAAREAGLLIVFEPPHFPRGTMSLQAARLSDIVKTSRSPGNRERNAQFQPDAATRFLVETLGSQGVRVRHRSGSGWADWHEIPSLSAPRVKDTAGAGDWMTAGVLASTLTQKGDIGIDTLLESVRYGQRLSAISIAFDGPAGALTALGSSTIENVASGDGPIRVPCANNACGSTTGAGGILPPPNHCELCLTPNPPKG